MKKEYGPELDAYTDWLQKQEKSPATILKYTHTARAFLEFSRKPLALVTKDDALAYKEALIGRCKPATVNSCVISLNALFKFLKNESLCVKTLKIQRKMSLNNILSEQEYALLLDAARQGRQTRLYLLVRVLASSGIRVHELRYITADMLKTGKVCVHSKGKAREICLANALRNELRTFCETNGIRDADVVFHGRNKRRMLDKARIWRELKALAARANVPPQKAHAHNFRHLFAKQYLAKYHDLVDLADVLGHNSVETTRIYTRTSGQEKQARIDALGL